MPKALPADTWDGLADEVFAVELNDHPQKYCFRFLRARGATMNVIGRASNAKSRLDHCRSEGNEN
jgi:hypothetical protein